MFRFSCMRVEHIPYTSFLISLYLRDACDKISMLNNDCRCCQTAKSYTNTVKRQYKCWNIKMVLLDLKLQTVNIHLRLLHVHFLLHLFPFFGMSIANVKSGSGSDNDIYSQLLISHA
jgi:hypothetical protein